MTLLWIAVLILDLCAAIVWLYAARQSYYFARRGGGGHSRRRRVKEPPQRQYSIDHEPCDVCHERLGVVYDHFWDVYYCLSCAPFAIQVVRARRRLKHENRSR